MNEEMVGPVLQANAEGKAIADAILQSNTKASLIDRGSYLRIQCPHRCEVSKKEIEQNVGKDFNLPSDLEFIMISFKGQLTMNEEKVVWKS